MPEKQFYTATINLRFLAEDLETAKHKAAEFATMLATFQTEAEADDVEEEV